MRLRTSFALCLLALALPAACDDEGGTNDGGRVVVLPEPGLPRFQQLGAIPVPGGVVSPAGGNFMHRRVDFSIDTLLGTRSVGAVYNTADDAWRWSWELEYGVNGMQLVDETAAVHELISGDPFTPNRLFPGGHWVRVDEHHMRSIGGLVHQFHPNGKLEAIYWQSSDYPRLAYRTAQAGGVGRHVRVEQCVSASSCGLVYEIERDFFGRVKALEDRAGRRAEFSYDSEGRLASARDPLDIERGWTGRVYEWWGPRLAAITTSEGERTEYESGWTTGQLHVVRQVGTPNRVHRFTYDRLQGARPLNEPSRAMHHRDPEGYTTTFHVDGHRRARSVQRPSGATTHYEYTDASFELSALTRPDGTRTEWEFAGETEVVRTDPSGNVLRTEVRLDDAENRADPFRRPVERITDTLGPVEERGYDAKGRLEWIENGSGERTTLSYDAGNQLASLTPPHGISVTFSGYGVHGWPETIGVGGEIQTRSFDLVGNRLAETGLDVLDPRPGGEASREYDGDRNVSTLWLADSDPQNAPPSFGRVDIAYRSDARPLAILRPGGGDHEFVYDDTGRLQERRERVDGAWRATLYEVDALGRATAEVLPNGMRRERSYTSDGELAEVRSLRDGVLESEATLHWVNARLEAISDAAHPADETIAYDSAGRPRAITFPGGESLGISYDERSRRRVESYRLVGGSLLRILRFAYDPADRPTSLLDDVLPLVAWSYRDGRPDAIAYGNGLTESFGYDPVTGLEDARSLAGASGVVAFSSVHQALVTASAAVEVFASTTSPLATVSGTHQLGFDSASGTAGKRILRSGGEDLAFDELSNLVRAGAVTLAYNAERNRLISASDGQTAPLAYVSDTAGYVSSRDGVALSWTAEGRIAAVGSDTFEYDAFGRATRRVANGVERRLLFGGRVETDAVGVPVRMDLGSVSLELDTGATRYRHTDYRGNVDLISDAEGDVVAHYEYGAYGVVAMTGQDDGARTFAGGRLVQGLVVLGPRLHDALAGRFLAPDPVFQVVSQLAYTAGNPIRWWDPAGLESSPAARYAGGQARAAAGTVFFIGGVIATGVLFVVGAPTAALTIPGGLALLGASEFVDGLVEMVSAQAEQQQQKKLELSAEQPGGGGGSSGAGPTAPATPDPAGCSGCGELGSGGLGATGGFGFGVGGFGGGF